MSRSVSNPNSKGQVGLEAMFELDELDLYWPTSKQTKQQEKSNGFRGRKFFFYIISMKCDIKHPRGYKTELKHPLKVDSSTEIVTIPYSFMRIMSSIFTRQMIY